MRQHLPLVCPSHTTPQRASRSQARTLPDVHNSTKHIEKYEQQHVAKHITNKKANI